MKKVICEHNLLSEYQIRIVIALFLALTVIFIFGNGNVQEGDMVSNSNLKKTDFYSVSDAKVRAITGFRAGDQVALVIPVAQDITRGELRRLSKIHQKVKDFFPNYEVSSLVSIDRYTVDGMLGITHVDGQEIESENFDIETWKENVRKDVHSLGMFVGRDFDFFQIVISLNSDFEETDLRNEIATLMEGTETSWWKWIIWKNDVKPTGIFTGVLVRGWGFARGILTAILKTDILKTSSVAVICAVFLLYFITGSWKQSLYPSAIILLGMIWVRGSIGVFGELGFEILGEPIKERVYMLLVDSCILVNGISFPIRKLDAYNSFRSKFPGLSRGEIWEKTKRFDGKISIVAAISILGFMFSLSFNRGVVEFSILSGLAVSYLWLMTKYLLPAVHSLWGGEIEQGKETWFSRVFLSVVVYACYKLLVNKHHRKIFWGLVSFMAICIVTAIGIVVHDIHAVYNKKETFIELSTRSVDYLKDTIADESRIFLNQPNRSGFCSLQFFVKGDIYDPGFLKECLEYSKETKAKVGGVREVKSIVDKIVYISRAQFGVDIPNNREDIEYIYSLIDYSGSLAVLESQFCAEGIALEVFVPGERSTELERQTEETIKIFNPKTYKEVFDGSFRFNSERECLEILPYGRSHEYHQSDKAIQRSQPFNTFFSFWMISGMCCWWIGRRKEGIEKTNQIYDLNGKKTGIVMAVPFSFSSACIVFLMVFCGIPLDQAMSCIAPLSINAAIDFNLHMIDDFNDALMEGKNYPEALYETLCVKGKVNVVDILTNAFVFSFLMMSKFGPIKLTGTLLVLMMFTCGFGALVLMMSLLRVCIEPVDKK